MNTIFDNTVVAYFLGATLHSCCRPIVVRRMRVKLDMYLVGLHGSTKTEPRTTLTLAA